jgi:5-methylcytosine-specific restriction protein A
MKLIPTFIVGEQYRRSADIHAAFGGSRQSGISPSAIANAIFIFTGDSGEQHGYRDFEEVDENGCRVFHYCGEGQVGDMTLTRGNLALTRHSADGKAIYLFQSLGKSKPVRYLGEYIYLDHYMARGKDREGRDRQIIVFKLLREDDMMVLDKRLQNDEVSRAPIDLRSARVRALSAAVARNGEGTPNKGSRNLYVRSRAVRDYVLLRANGHCELCSAPAPFLNLDREPYLEPHHTTRVSDGGPDHPSFVGALCPACHREIHFGQHGASRNAELQARLREIEAGLALSLAA